MSLTQLEQLVLAHYLANGAQDLSIAPRFYPHGELILIVEDKINLGARRFGVKAGMACKNPAREFVDTMVEREAFSSVKNDFGGTMHQFRPDSYRRALGELQQTDPIVAKAREQGPEFWPQAFAQATG